MRRKGKIKRYFRRRLERLALFAVAGALMGTIMFSTEFSWWGVAGGMISGLLFFGLPALAPKGWMQDQIFAAGVGAAAGMIAAAAGYWFGENGESLTTWVFWGLIIGGFIAYYGGEIWADG